MLQLLFLCVSEVPVTVAAPLVGVTEKTAMNGILILPEREGKCVNVWRGGGGVPRVQVRRLPNAPQLRSCKAGSV